MVWCAWSMYVCVFLPDGESFVIYISSNSFKSVKMIRHGYNNNKIMIKHAY